MNRTYYVYVMYIGITDDLNRRVHGRKRTNSLNGSPADDISMAIAREKDIKTWWREKKNALVEALNPRCEELAVDEL